MLTRGFSLVIVLAASSFCHASTVPDGIPVAPDEFAEVRPDVEDTIRKSDRYRTLDRNERKEIIDALDRMEKTLSTVSHVDELDPRQRTQLFNDQETVNHALTQARGDSKVICRREKRVGSNFRVSHCTTVGEQRAHKEAVDRELPRIPRYFPPGGGPR